MFNGSNSDGLLYVSPKVELIFSTYEGMLCSSFSSGDGGNGNDNLTEGDDWGDLLGW